MNRSSEMNAFLKAARTCLKLKAVMSSSVAGTSISNAHVSSWRMVRCPDLGTKSHTSEEHERLMRMAGLVHGEGFDAPVVDVHAIERAARPAKNCLNSAVQSLLAMLIEENESIDSVGSGKW